MSPWILGFSIFFGYPLVMTRVLLVHPLRPVVVAALDRARELQFLFNGDQRIWPAVANTLWMIAVACR